MFSYKILFFGGVLFSYISISASRPSDNAISKSEASFLSPTPNFDQDLSPIIPQYQNTFARRSNPIIRFGRSIPYESISAKEDNNQEWPPVAPQSVDIDGRRVVIPRLVRYARSTAEAKTVVKREASPYFYFPWKHRKNNVEKKKLSTKLMRPKKGAVSKREVSPLPPPWHFSDINQNWFKTGPQFVDVEARRGAGDVSPVDWSRFVEIVDPRINLLDLSQERSQVIPPEVDG